MVPAITTIQAFECFKYDIVRPIDILKQQRETKTVGKDKIVWPDFFRGLRIEYKNGELDIRNMIMGALICIAS